MRGTQWILAASLAAVACGGGSPNGTGDGSNGNGTGDGGNTMSGTLIAKSTPTGARVVLDGNPTLARTTPDTYTGLEAGAHRLDFSLMGYTSTYREFSLDDPAHPMTVEVTLDLLAQNPIVRPGETPVFPVGTLVVQMNRSDSSGEIVITPDGEAPIATGMQTPAEIRLQAGRTYTVSAQRNGFLSSTESVFVGNDERREVVTRLAMNLNGMWRLVEVNGGPPTREDVKQFTVDMSDPTCRQLQHQGEAGDGCLKGLGAVLKDRQLLLNTRDGTVDGSVDGDNIIWYNNTMNGLQPLRMKWVKVVM
ncbi:PEGA domain-containing protein [Candidatus Uhrbacteria bacterium]|nr:PEGA domain-containing protein [Candidatus Uhrbacteria bacterium]